MNKIRRKYFFYCTYKKKCLFLQSENKYYIKKCLFYYAFLENTFTF